MNIGVISGTVISFLWGITSGLIFIGVLVLCYVGLNLIILKNEIILLDFHICSVELLLIKYYIA